MTGLQFLIAFLQPWSSLDVPTATGWGCILCHMPTPSEQTRKRQLNFAYVSSPLMKFFIDAMLATGFINVCKAGDKFALFHTSTLWPIWGKERKCKKEMSVGRHPEEVVIRMMAWWVAQGFLEQHWVFVVTCVPITSSSQQCWCRHHTLTRWIWIRAETFVDVVVGIYAHGPNGMPQR